MTFSSPEISQGQKILGSMKWQIYKKILFTAIPPFIAINQQFEFDSLALLYRVTRCLAKMAQLVRNLVDVLTLLAGIPFVILTLILEQINTDVLLCYYQAY